MNKQQTMRAVYGLASGTQAGLFGTNVYSEIEAAAERWLTWVESQPEGSQWETWQDCWHAYDRSRHTVRRDALADFAI